MYIKTTKKLAAILNKNSNYHISIKQFNEEQYNWYVGGGWLDSECDYNYNTGLYNSICVEYPESYYAANRYISTVELCNIFKRNKCGTLNDFIAAFNTEIEI